VLFFGVPDMYIYEDEGRKGALEEMRVWVLIVVCFNEMG
jgi:hypothetical protein